MPQLKRELNGFDLTMIAIGGTIGAGIFLAPDAIARSLPSARWIMLVWMFGGLHAICGALTFAELGAMMPRAGGIYVYLTEAFGGLVGFLFGWAYFLVVNTGGIAGICIGFATYFGQFVDLGPVGLKVVAITGLALLTAINVLGVKAGGMFSDVFTMLKLVGIAGLIVVGLGWGSSSVTDFAAPLPPTFTGSVGSAFAVALIGVIFSYGGWQHATFVAAEAKDPQRTLPTAMILGAGTVMVVYLLANLAYFFLMTPSQIAASPRVAAEAMGIVFGATGATIIALVIFISTFGTAGIYTLTAPRIFYAMANDGAFFRKVAEVHPTFHTPAFAILFQSVWVVVLILFWGTFENLISYVVFTDGIFFALGAMTLLVFRYTRPNAPRPYRTFGYPITPLFFIAVEIWFIAKLLIARPAQAWGGLLMLGLGVPVYYYWKRKFALVPVRAEGE